MKVFVQRLAVGFTGIGIAAVLMIVGAFFFEGLSSSNITTQWILNVAGRMIIPVIALAVIALIAAYPR